MKERPVKRAGSTLRGDESTHSGESDEHDPTPRMCRLTVLCHPDLGRVGECALLGELSIDQPAALSRNEPVFSKLRDPMSSTSLRDQYVSRRGIQLRRAEDGSVTITNPGGPSLVVDGSPVAGNVTLLREAVLAGVVIELGRRVTLLLHDVIVAPRAPEHGLVGESDAVEELRRAITRTADLDVPVLIRGETGSGKEHVAQAIHAASPRAAGPCVAVNVATISPQTAASELFGHVKGSFTGAHQRHAGVFERADSGTLLLDEVGELPGDVQSMMLRVLETGEVLALGDDKTRSVNVRVICATDADLEAAAAAGTFRSALLHRLSGCEIVVPALRERRDDIARLLVHFLRDELARVGEEHKLEPAAAVDAPPWLPSALMARLLRHSWPGNVRQLRNVARQIVISSRGLDVLRVDASVERLLGEPRGQAAGAPLQMPQPRARREIGEDALIEALRAHGWAFGAAAASLGIPRSTLYDLAEKSARIRKAPEISEEELLLCFESCGGDLRRMSDQLLVSIRALQLRLTSLGIIGDVDKTQS